MANIGCNLLQEHVQEQVAPAMVDKMDDIITEGQGVLVFEAMDRMLNSTMSRQLAVVEDASYQNYEKTRLYVDVKASISEELANASDKPAQDMDVQLQGFGIRTLDVMLGRRLSAVTRMGSLVELQLVEDMHV
jgi:hypothetical protein